jgi:hypothetical protein
MICILAMFGFNACEVSVPPADTTPPRVILMITGPGISEMVSDDTGYKSVTLDRDMEYTLSAIAADPDGGVRLARITGGITVSCYDTESGVTRLNDFSYYEQEPAVPVDLGPGEVGVTGRFVHLSLNADGDAFDPPSGCRFTSAMGSFMADVENNHDMWADTPFLLVTVE